jgi:hypothetical protein
MNKRTRHTVLAVGILVLVFGLAVILIHPLERYQRARCNELLKLIGNAVWVYRGEHGRLPQQFEVLSNELSNPVFLICPGSGHSPGSLTNADSWADYTLIDWSVVLGTNAVPDNYPIAYDRFMSNHAGHGVNVLTVDGFVRWDSNAEWLKKFSAEHPEAKLPMPQ